jgi:hypothetical protein
MSNKINKYSWIHQLNQAALESKLLSEAKLFEQQMNPFERSMSQAGGDIDVYRQILNKKRKDVKPSDVDGDGDADAEDVKIDGNNNTVGEEDRGAVDPSMMAQYPSLQRGMRMGSRDPDAIINNLYSGIDDAIDRRNRSAPSATRYDVADLQRMARLLGNQ